MVSELLLHIQCWLCSFHRHFHSDAVRRQRSAHTQKNTRFPSSIFIRFWVVPAFGLIASPCLGRCATIVFDSFGYSSPDDFADAHDSVWLFTLPRNIFVDILRPEPPRPPVLNLLSLTSPSPPANGQCYKRTRRRVTRPPVEMFYRWKFFLSAPDLSWTGLNPERCPDPGEL